MKRISAGAKWLKAVQEQKNLGPEEIELAKLAAEQLDTVETARQALKKHGPLVKGKFGLKSNPAVEIARKAGESFARLAKALKMAGEEKRRVGRPSLQDRTWKQSSAPEKTQEPDEWSDFDLPRAKTQ